MIVQDQDRPVLRWGASLGGVLAAHAAIIGVLCWWRARLPPAPPVAPAEAVMVELAPLPAAPPAPPTQLPPGPAQREQREARPKTGPEPARTPDPQQRPRQETEVPLPPQPAARAHEDTANADVDRTSAPPSVEAQSNREYAANQSLAGAQSQAQASWQAQVLGHLEKFKRYPRAALRRRYEGTALVEYRVDRQGQVLSARLAASSGHDVLDAEAIAALQRASPLPPPPPEIIGDPVEVTTPVAFTLR